MKSKDLKLFALFYIDEQKISDKDKLSLMNFIESADDEKILFLLATGQLPSEANLIVRESEGQVFRIESVSSKSRDLARKIAHQASIQYMYNATNINAMATMLSMKVKKEKMAQQATKCDKEKGTARKACYNMVRRDSIRAQLRALNAMKIRCNKAKSSEACIKNIDNRMKKLLKQMDAIKVSV